MKQVLIVNHYSGNSRVGMEYRHRYLSRYFLQSEFEVSIVSASFSHLYSSPPDISKTFSQEQDEGLNQYWIKTPVYSGNGISRLINMIVFTIRLCFLTMRGKVGRPNYVICSTPHPFVVINMLFFKWFCKSKTVFEVRDIWPLMLIELGQLSKLNPLCWLFRLLEKIGYKYSDATVSLWSDAEKYSIESGVMPGKYFYIPNGIEVSEVQKSYDNNAVDLVNSLHDKGYFVVGYGGSHGLANPLDQVIEAARISEERKSSLAWVMVGDGPEKERAVRKSEELGLKNLYWLPPESKKDIMGFYSKLDVCFIGLKRLPLFKYGPTPNKLMDYMLASKPIVFSIDTPYDPTKMAGCGLFAQPDSGESLCETVLKLQELEGEDLDDMGKKGRIFAEENLSYQSLASKYIEVFSAIDG